MSVVFSRDAYPGALVRIAGFPFDDGSGRKPRPAIVVEAGRGRVLVRGIFTRNHHDRYRPIPSFRGLDHAGYVADRLVPVDADRIVRWLGDTPADFDPYGDFAAQAA